MTNKALIGQLLDWIGSEPRNYAETVEAWRTSCPRLTIWEDALSDGLVERIKATASSESRVQVTEKGRAFLADIGCPRNDGFGLLAASESNEPEAALG